MLLGIILKCTSYFTNNQPKLVKILQEQNPYVNMTQDFNTGVKFMQGVD